LARQEQANENVTHGLSREWWAGCIIASWHLDISVPWALRWRMRTTLHIDDDVYEAARHLAERERTTVGRVISRLARRGLRPSGRHRAERGFPVFDVPADATPITAAVVRRALDET
jgi:hypothetical protein